MHFNDSRVAQASKGKKIESEVDQKRNALINYYERGNGYCESAKIRKNGFICPRPSLLETGTFARAKFTSFDALQIFH